MNKINIDFLSEGINENLEQNVQLILFRVISELINNTLKHANANKILISIKEENKKIIIKISDNGSGFNKNFAIVSNGLNNMQKRIEEIGGTFNLESEINNGTTISIII